MQSPGHLSGITHQHVELARLRCRPITGMTVDDRHYCALLFGCGIILRVKFKLLSRRFSLILQGMYFSTRPFWITTPQHSSGKDAAACARMAVTVLSRMISLSEVKRRGTRHNPAVHSLQIEVYSPLTAVRNKHPVKDRPPGCHLYRTSRFALYRCSRYRFCTSHACTGAHRLNLPGRNELPAQIGRAGKFKLYGFIV